MAVAGGLAADGAGAKRRKGKDKAARPAAASFPCADTGSRVCADA